MNSATELLDRYERIDSSTVSPGITDAYRAATMGMRPTPRCTIREGTAMTDAEENDSEEASVLKMVIDVFVPGFRAFDKGKLLYGGLAIVVAMPFAASLRGATTKDF